MKNRASEQDRDYDRGFTTVYSTLLLKHKILPSGGVPRIDEFTYFGSLLFSPKVLSDKTSAFRVYSGEFGSSKMRYQ